MLLSQRWTTQSALCYVVSEGTASGYVVGVGLLGRATLSGCLGSVGLLTVVRGRLLSQVLNYLVSVRILSRRWAT